MFSRFSRGQRARIDLPDSDRAYGLRDARLDAWALLVGEIRDADGGRYRIARRPHRGQLPDVDFSLAVPVPARRPLVLRLLGRVARLFRRRRSRAGLSGHGVSALGERPPPSYIGVTEAGDPADFIPAHPAPIFEYDRAA